MVGSTFDAAPHPEDQAMPKAKAKAKAKARAKGQATAESPGAGEARRRGQQPKRTREDLTAETAPREPTVSTSAAGGHAADGTPPGSEGQGPEVIETPPKRVRLDARAQTREPSAGGRRATHRPL